MLSPKAMEIIAKSAEVSLTDTHLVLQALADLLKETVHGKGEAVGIAGLGVFSRRVKYETKAHTIEFKENFKD